MNCLCVCFRVNRDWRNAKVAAGTNYSHRDLASICNQDFVEHEKQQTADSKQQTAQFSNQLCTVYRASLEAGTIRVLVRLAALRCGGADSTFRSLGSFGDQAVTDDQVVFSAH